MQINDKQENITVVLTVGTLAQKNLCEAFINLSESLPAEIKVIYDGEFGCRIGSGGAVLNAIGKFYKNSGKLIIVNCGGFSKRTVNCAVKGKAFADVMQSGKLMTLFELIVRNSLSIAKSFESGVLITCSDILISTENLTPDFSNSTGFGFPCDIQTGTKHGVMVADGNNVMTRFIHKAEEQTLRRYADPESGCVTVDSGMVYLDTEVSDRLLELALNYGILSILCRNKSELNLYSDIIPLLASETDYQSYIEISGTRHEVKKILFDALNQFTMNVCTVNGDFIHLGTTKQLLEHTLALSGCAEGYLALNSFVGENSEIGEGTLLDNVYLPSDSAVGSDCIISDIYFESPVKIGNGFSVCGFRLNDGSFVTVVTDINENPKNSSDSVELWKKPRFYKAQSFDNSLNKFFTAPDEEKISLEHCAENAAVQHYITNRLYLSGLTQSKVHPKYPAMRSSVIDSYFSRKQTPAHFSCVCDSVSISMPVRVNLCGTWSDAMPYCIENGGKVINAAVTVDGALPINVKLEKLGAKTVEFCSDEEKSVFSFGSGAASDALSDFNLHKAVLKTIGIESADMLDCGFRLSTTVDIIDKGSGLGTSSILLAACFKAFSQMFDLDYSDEQLIEMVFVAEQIMKTGGGWQDQAGGLSGGIKAVSSLPGIPQKTTVEHISIPESFRAAFSSRAVLMPTGERHFGRFIVNDVAHRYLSGNPDSLRAYSLMSELNGEMINAIESGDEKGFCRCLNEHMQLLRAVSPAVTTPQTERVISTCAKMADAVSICGAGAGGYLLVILKNGVSFEEFSRFIASELPDIKSKILRTDIFEQGESK